MGIDTEIITNDLVKIDEKFLQESLKRISDTSKVIEGSEKEALLKKCIGHIDLTSLNTTDTTETIEKLCSKVININHINYFFF